MLPADEGVYECAHAEDRAHCELAVDQMVLELDRHLFLVLTQHCVVKCSLGRGWKFGQFLLHSANFLLSVGDLHAQLPLLRTNAFQLTR
jgi:hypothetical protein